MKSRELWVAAFIVGFNAACGDDEVSYREQLDPLFQHRCVACHFADNGYIDFENPFTEGKRGLSSKSIWFEGGHLAAREFNVVPYEPDESFVLQKVSDETLRASACDWDGENGAECPSQEEGFFMPPERQPASKDQLDRIRQWILDGAEDTDYFRQSVLPIFGDRENRSGFECENAGFQEGCSMCINCHRPDGPWFPYDFTPADLVNVPAQFRADWTLVVPGAPEESFLLKKLEIETHSSEWGAPMPYAFEPFSADQVALLRRWIAEGAKNN